MPSFDDFLRTGRIGPLALGITREAVQDLLGRPSLASDNSKFTNWKYGPLLLTFELSDPAEPARLGAISYQCWSGEHPPEELGVTGWLPTLETDFGQFRAYLEKLGNLIKGEPPHHGKICFSISPTQKYPFGPKLNSSFSAGPSLLYDDIGWIWDIAILNPDQHDRRRISVEATHGQWESFAEEADYQGVSVASICSRWIHAIYSSRY